MGSSDRLFNRQRSVHDVLGGGLGKLNYIKVFSDLIFSFLVE